MKRQFLTRLVPAALMLLGVAVLLSGCFGASLVSDAPQDM